MVGFFAHNQSALAALAAIVGIPILIWQIAQSGWHEQRRLKRRHLAAQATLPMTLTGIIEWVRRAMRALQSIYAWTKGRRRGVPPVFEPPEFPTDLIAAIERMIEASPKSRVASVLAAIVSDIQTLGSRMRAVVEGGAEEMRAQSLMIDDNIIMAASIYARAESLFDYARAPSRKAPLDYTRVSSAMNLMDMREHQYHDVHETINRRWLQSRSWREKAGDSVRAKWRRLRERIGGSGGTSN